MFYKRSLILLSLVVFTKLCSASDDMFLPEYEGPRAIVALSQASDDDCISKKSDKLFIRGNFNRDYKFSKSDIAKLALISLITSFDSIVCLLASAAYEAGKGALAMTGAILSPK